MRVLWLLALALLAGGLLLALVELAPFVRAFAALIVVLLPTYMIVWPILRPRLGTVGAFTVAGALSIAILAITGLGLNLLPWGIQAATWLGAAAVLLVIALASGRPPTWHFTREVAPHELVLVGLGGLMLMAAIVSVRGFAGYPTESFTQLWISPTADPPTASVEIHIRSEEEAGASYRLVVLRNGAVVESWNDIRLRTGQTWSRTVSVGSGRIEARLFRSTHPGTPYRSVTLQLASVPDSARRNGA
jgi:hypothetical protein